ncbi:Gfo/Idh/MocA family oxidoreductase [Hoyosella altamirensis]|uniref:Myo-inositol 2-dehydrogenase/D-chiro-inositol 1-dehydrogenase n=1 Tax=Hoyosella altamirensis TaxID=616997 RepID=A0A839RRJ4_9ACTN|nr:Gfo/Idh/MocA family oxidoreductase [Hoyosella altamirensis]MBB3039465.1 myo-inositol 2-dehydrogenase/D-chiro-inositol 1-dehydrogenase [Hoyosella altamirensis]
MPVRIGVIGLGVMGADHVRTLHGMVANAVVTRVTDINAERSAQLGAEIESATVSSDGMELINDRDVDAVIIASHDSTHAELATACVKAGKPVLCEKPLAPTSDEAAGVVAAENGAGLISLGFNRRFDPAFAELRSVAQSGDLGAPLLVHFSHRNVESYPGADSAFSITGSAIHEFDTVPWLLGSPIVEVSWHAPKRSGRVPEKLQDPQLMLLRTADGVLTTAETFINAAFGYDVRCEVVCETGAVQVTKPDHTTVDVSGRRGTRYPSDWRPRFADSYRRELQAWVGAIMSGSPTPLATARDGLAASAVAEAVVTSMNSGGKTVTVTIPEI